MTDAAQTFLSNDRPASPVRERVGSISAEAALGKPTGSGSAHLSVVTDKAATGARRQRSESALYLLAGDLMSSPAISVWATEPVSSVARLMLESGISGAPVLDAGGRPVGMVTLKWPKLEGSSTLRNRKRWTNINPPTPTKSRPRWAHKRA